MINPDSLPLLPTLVAAAILWGIVIISPRKGNRP